MVAAQLARESAKLVIICANNSLRSHMGALWAQVAAVLLRVPWILTFSGCTKTTGFDRLTIKAILHAGFKIERADRAHNARYSLSWIDEVTSIASFSKVRTIQQGASVQS